MDQPQLKLSYFDIKGRAELSRILFNYGGIAFEDDRVARPDFAAMKPTLPFGQVPLLEVDGTVYAQSMAIARYADKLVGLYPAGPREALTVDVFSCSLCEVENLFIEFMFKTSDEAKKAERKKVFSEQTVPRYFATLEKLVQGTFILGDELSYADVQLLDVVDNKIKWAFPDFTLDGFPKLATVVSHVKAEPKIAAYLDK